MISPQIWDIFTRALAIWGALLSTILAVTEISKVRRKIKVIVDFLVQVDLEKGEKSTISIRAVNVGPRPIEITKAGFMFENREDYLNLLRDTGTSPLPRRIEYGESVLVTFNLQDLESIVWDSNYKEMKLKKAYVKDAEGRIYTTKLSREEMSLLDRATENFLKKEKRHMKPDGPVQ
jgi:hypothetical protein